MHSPSSTPPSYVPAPPSIPTFPGAYHPVINWLRALRDEDGQGRGGGEDEREEDEREEDEQGLVLLVSGCRKRLLTRDERRPWVLLEEGQPLPAEGLYISGEHTVLL